VQPNSDIAAIQDVLVRRLDGSGKPRENRYLLAAEADSITLTTTGS